MDQQELSKFIPDEAIFVKSVTDGRRGIFKLWYKLTKDGIVQTVQFIRENGHWVFCSDLNLKLEV